MKRQIIRKRLTYISFFLFPATFIYFSPYVIVDSALKGIVCGSLIFFVLLFLASIFLGRAFCSWACPLGGAQEMLSPLKKKVARKAAGSSTGAPAKKVVKKAAIGEKKAPVKKAPARKTTATKAPARKAPVTKIEKKKVLELFEDSIISVPFKAANKTFMASLGLLSYVQDEIDKQYKQFDKKFTKYAKDGEKVFDQLEDRVEDFRKDVEKKVDEARDRVRHTFNKAA